MTEDHLREVVFLRHRDGLRFSCKLRKNFRIMFICVKIVKTRESGLLKNLLVIALVISLFHARSLDTGDRLVYKHGNNGTMKNVTQTESLKVKVAPFEQ